MNLRPPPSNIPKPEGKKWVDLTGMDHEPTLFDDVPAAAQPEFDDNGTIIGYWTTDLSALKDRFLNWVSRLIARATPAVKSRRYMGHLDQDTFNHVQNQVDPNVKPGRLMVDLTGLERLGDQTGLKRLSLEQQAKARRTGQPLRDEEE